MENKDRWRCCGTPSWKQNCSRTNMRQSSSAWVYDVDGVAVAKLLFLT
jgi:hypothetical protein